MLNQLLNQKGIKAKELTEQLSKALLNGEIGVNELIPAADKLKDAVKASCIEAIEHATKTKMIYSIQLPLIGFVNNYTRKHRVLNGNRPEYWEM